MTAILQLLKEFWAPLAIGIAWTSFNIYQMPRESWTLTGFVNLFAPTFFFASWLVAQWYRVRKQQRVEDSLAAIGARISGVSFPILPFKLIIVSRHTSTPEMLQAVFANRDEYRDLSGEPTLMSIPFGPDLKLWNWSGMVAKERYCVIEHPDLPALVTATSESKETPIKLPIRLSVAVFFSQEKDRPLIFRARDTWSDKGLTRLQLFDNLVYQEFSFKEWDIENATRRAWSVIDLRGATILVTFKYLFFDLLNIKNPPYINDLQFCFGLQSANTLFLKSAQLEGQRWIQDQEDSSYNQINEHSRMMSLVVEFSVDDRLYSEQIVQVASAQ